MDVVQRQPIWLGIAGISFARPRRANLRGRESSSPPRSDDASSAWGARSNHTSRTDVARLRFLPAWRTSFPYCYGTNAIDFARRQKHALCRSIRFASFDSHTRGEVVTVRQTGTRSARNACRVKVSTTPFRQLRGPRRRRRQRGPARDRRIGNAFLPHRRVQLIDKLSECEPLP